MLTANQPCPDSFHYPQTPKAISKVPQIRSDQEVNFLLNFWENQWRKNNNPMEMTPEITSLVKTHSGETVAVYQTL